VEGATGYEFIHAVSGLMISEGGAAALERAYATLEAAPPADSRRVLAKRRVLTFNFEGELEGLTDRFSAELPEAPREEVREAAAALIVSLPVYRTYGDADGFSAIDRARLDAAAAQAAETADGALAARLVEIMARSGEVEARARFQQLTGPVMAKAVEDTLFYRHNALLALNEVGCDPVEPPAGAEAIRRFLIERRGRSPEALNATATHDTKRGEDARARLFMLAHDPERWIASSARWSLSVPAPAGGPGPAVVWTIHQALAGAWPSTDAPPGEEALADLRERFRAYLLKALREAKLRTSWTDQDPDYEEAAADYADSLLSPENAGFQADFHETLRPYAEGGRVASLAQLLLKLTAPGIPDLYQGAEAGDFSLVDPDNRRPVDFASLARALEAPASPGALGPAKQRLIAAALGDRGRRPALYREGAFEPLAVNGADAEAFFAYARSDASGRCVAVLPMRPMATGEAPDARIRVPAGPPLRDLLAPERSFEDPELSAAVLFETGSVALLAD
jgi:(1->4)-alpha-D-glucan 1-alpha-D-glucosylmutase